MAKPTVTRHPHDKKTGAKQNPISYGPAKKQDLDFYCFATLKGANEKGGKSSLKIGCPLYLPGKSGLQKEK